jgi:outer membrane lipoprotein-sorting protein
MHTRTRVLIVAGVVLLGAVAGCAQQSPAQTQADVNQAAAQGARDVATVRDQSDQRVRDAQRDLTSKEDEVTRAAATGDRRLTVAESEATHGVAIQRCAFQTGDARTACQDRADEALSAAKASVEASKSGGLAPGQER